MIENLIIFKYTGRLTHEDSFLYFYKVQPLQKSSVRWKKCLLIHLPTEIHGETVANECVSTRKTVKNTVLSFLLKLEKQNVI